MFPRNHVQNLFKIEMATSKSFEADLPDMTEEQLSKLYLWGKSSCEAFDARMNRDMTMIIVATRKKAGTVRDHMRLLRTNLLNWGVSLPSNKSGGYASLRTMATPQKWMAQVRRQRRQRVARFKACHKHHIALSYPIISCTRPSVRDQMVWV